MKIDKTPLSAWEDPEWNTMKKTKKKKSRLAKPITMDDLSEAPPRRRNSKKASKRKASKPAPPPEEPWGVRVSVDLLDRLRVVCAQRRASRTLPNTQKTIAESILEDWLRKVGG